MAQKFEIGQKVYIEPLDHMDHFPQECDAIVVNSYTEANPGESDGPEEYSLFLLDKKQECSWYPEDKLSLLDGDAEVGKKILIANNYKFIPIQQET